MYHHLQANCCSKSSIFFETTHCSPQIKIKIETGSRFWKKEFRFRNVQANTWSLSPMMSQPAAWYGARCGVCGEMQGWWWWWWWWRCQQQDCMWSHRLSLFLCFPREIQHFHGGKHPKRWLNRSCTLDSIHHQQLGLPFKELKCVGYYNNTKQHVDIVIVIIAIIIVFVIIIIIIIINWLGISIKIWCLPLLLLTCCLLLLDLMQPCILPTISPSNPSAPSLSSICRHNSWLGSARTK